MIISHRHRFIFFAQPRTGTHAIRAALTPHLGAGDWQQQALTAQLRLPVPSLARIGHGHLTLRQVQAALEEDIWRTYFKFSVVRDPYDRYVSICSFLNRRNTGYRGNELSFMKRALGVGRFRQRVLVRPQVELLRNEAGELGMDFIGRYETLQQSFDEVCRTIGIPASELVRGNASDHRPYPSYYDDELQGLVADFYRSDFESLDYDLGAVGRANSCA